DDFGTGYSSLTHIRVLPVDVVKVDQTFVRRMLSEPEDCKIVEGVIALAQSFNIQVIAEGVESIAHGEVLLAMGCNQAQGYALAKPLPIDQLMK
ncbi:MAG TPA: diguanylate cyclase, partial [Methylophaga sp.]|nr:diguanylate cyclase [Methylophaga sp.]